MATVGKKFTSPNKWDEAWFNRLSPKQKLLYMYLSDRCDHAGVIEFIPHLWSAHLGMNVTDEFYQKFASKINEDKKRIRFVRKKVWLIDYIRFQQKPDLSKPISATHPMIKTIYRLLKEHGLYEDYKEYDSIAFIEYESENGISELSKALTSHGEGNRKALSRSASRGGGNNSSPGGKVLLDSDSDRIPNGEKLHNGAIKALSVFLDNPDDKEDFFEYDAAKKILRGLTFSEKFEVEKAVNMLVKYLEGEKIRLKEIDQDYNLEEVINKFDNEQSIEV